MAQFEKGKAHPQTRERRDKSQVAQFLTRVWSEWRAEVFIVGIVALAVFLLVERMEIRQTLLAWARQWYQTASQLVGDVLRSLEAVAQRTTLSDLTGVALLAVALAFVTWRIRWRIMRAPRYTARTCPLCGADLRRAHRRRRDRIASLYLPVRRYRCRNRDCRWTGLRVWTDAAPPDQRPAE